MRLILLIVLTGAITFQSFGQNKTSFIGVVTSEQLVEINSGKEIKRDQTTTLEFAPRLIRINDESFEIVNKQFDGISTSTFMCSKGRGHFVIKYVSGDYISVSDKRTPGIETKYLLSKE